MAGKKPDTPHLPTSEEVSAGYVLPPAPMVVARLDDDDVPAVSVNSQPGEK